MYKQISMKHNQVFVWSILFVCWCWTILTHPLTHSSFSVLEYYTIKQNEIQMFSTIQLKLNNYWIYFIFFITPSTNYITTFKIVSRQRWFFEQPITCKPTKSWSIEWFCKMIKQLPNIREGRVS
jgi:hypothetical protein